MEKNKKVFVNVPTEVGQTEAEEIGVEHLLRDVKDASISTLTTEIDGRIQGMSLFTRAISKRVPSRHPWPQF